MLKHAGESGAQVFDGVKINAIEFVPSDIDTSALGEKNPSPGRAVAATWTRKEDGVTGRIEFDYLVDASGRFGIMSTKYLKNRKFNKGLKNVASWSYWKNTGKYAPGTPRDNQPFFEALTGISLTLPRFAIGISANKYLQMLADGVGPSPSTTAPCPSASSSAKTYPSKRKKQWAPPAA